MERGRPSRLAPQRWRHACFVTVADLPGRCVLSLPYAQQILLPERLAEGSYRVFIADEKETATSYVLWVQSK